MKFAEILESGKIFFDEQKRRLQEYDIDITGYELSHLAYRTATVAEYTLLRDTIEEHCSANVENVWNGRPISKMVLAEPVMIDAHTSWSLLELIPPTHENLYKMGFEHAGIVIGNSIDEFSKRYREELTGQQFQSINCEPYFKRFHDHTCVKFYRYSLMEVCIKEGHTFEGFNHVS